MTEEKKDVEEKGRPVQESDIVRYDQAIKVLLSMSELVLVKGIMENKEDEAVLRKSVRIATEYLQYDYFRISAQNKLMREYKEGDELKSKEVELKFEQTEDGCKYPVAVVPEHKEDEKYFMFLFGTPHLLKPGTKILNVNDMLVPVVENTVQE